MATATTTAPKAVKARRQPLPGEVNITNNKVARAALEEFRAQKVRENDGAKAKRERTKEGGSEAILRDALGTNGTVLVVNGQPVVKVSSERHTIKVDFDLLAKAFPEAFAKCVSKVSYDFLSA